MKLKEMCRSLLLVIAMPILALTSAHAQTSYQLTGACLNGICNTNIPTEALDIYLTSNDSSGVPYQIGVYAAPDYHFVENLPVAADGTFPGGALTNVNVVVLIHKKGRFETKQVTLTATVTFNDVSPAVVAPTSVQPVGTTYTASSGYVSSSNTANMDFYGGGDATVAVNLPYYCSNGKPCNFQGREVQYTLPDGSVAILTNLTGSFDGVGTITGQASGTDSNGNSVSVDVTFSYYQVPSHSGRGGGNSKLFVGGSLTVTVSPTSAGPGMPAPMPPLRCDLEPDGPCCRGTKDLCKLPCGE